jgi:D-alanyl-D-alanine carboxypeptidase
MKIAQVIVLSMLLSSTTAAQAPALRSHPEVASTIDLLERWITAIMEDRAVPGLAIAVVHDRETVWMRGFGYGDLERKIPMRTSTIFRIASITKTFTATATLVLRDEGKLHLDDPVVQYLPWFRLRRSDPEEPAITVRHLLLHTSGLPREAAFPYWTDHVFPSREQIREALPRQEPVYPPETRYKYSNLGIALLGEVVAAASGESYERFVTERLLEPLGMVSTSVFLTPEQRERLATGYGRRMPDGTRAVSPETEARGLAPAANISSSVEDMARYAAFHLSEDSSSPGSVLRPSTLREMHRVQWVYPGWRSGRALGFGVTKTDARITVGHSGWVAGHRSSLLMSPGEKTAVIVMVNADDAEPATVSTRALAMLAPAIQHALRADTAPAPPPQAWNRYKGTYVDPWGWRTDVLVYHGRLVLYDYSYPPEEDPTESLTDLSAEGEHTFRMTGANGSGELAVFELGPDGEVTRLKLGENYTYPVRNPE